MGYGQSDARGYVNARELREAKVRQGSMAAALQERELELQRRRAVGEWWRRYETARAWDRFLAANGTLAYVAQRYGVGR